MLNTHFGIRGQSWIASQVFDPMVFRFSVFHVAATLSCKPQIAIVCDSGFNTF